MSRSRWLGAGEGGSAQSVQGHGHCQIEGQGDFALGFLFSESGKITVGWATFKFQKPLGEHKLCGVFLLLGDQSLFTSLCPG